MTYFVHTFPFVFNFFLSMLIMFDILVEYVIVVSWNDNLLNIDA
jgi:hypothetical protein